MTAPPVKTTIDDIMDPDGYNPTERQVKVLRNHKGPFNQMVLRLVPLKGGTVPDIHSQEVMSLIWDDDGTFRLERERNPQLDREIKTINRDLRARRMAVNSSLHLWHTRGRIQRVGHGRYVRLPDEVPNGALVEAVVGNIMEKAAKEIEEGRKKNHEFPVKRRKTARDVDLEDHLRLRHPTGLITADNLLAYFAIQGVTDPRTAASVRLARLVTLDVVERMGPANSGVYRLLPPK